MAGNMIDWQSKEFETVLLNLLHEIESVAKELKKGTGFKFGQKEAVLSLYEKIKNHGAILADEVGLGKTRVALILMEAVLRAGGTVAAVVPSGLMFQWEEEAQDFSKFLRDPCITKKITRLSGFNNLFSNSFESNGNSVSYPLSMNIGGKCQWPLISHRFGPILPNVKAKGQYAFFEYIGYRLQKKMKKQKWVRFNKENKKGYESAARFLSPENDTWFELLKQSDFAPLKPKGIKKIKEEGDSLSRYVIKCLIGKIDFLVIDEAHKGKSSLDEKEDDIQGGKKVRKTRLASLLDGTLNIDSCGRKLCMTATPVELTTDNWTQILNRCGVKDVRKNVFDDFHQALNEIRCCPTNEGNLRSLERASGEFENYLQDFVTRRLRCHQDEYNKLVDGLKHGVAEEIKYSDAAHIHRLSQASQVELKPGSEWQKVIMCCEGIRLAAKGLPGKGNAKYRRIQTRYPAGLIDDPESIEYIDLKTIKDPKEKRMYFWRNQAASFIEPTTIHPKIEKTANLIEEILEKNECQKYLAKGCEKVLVFGTYTKPMEQLRYELNGRNYVRRVVAGKLIQNKISAEEKNKIYSIYSRMFKEKKLSNERLGSLIMTSERFFKKANKLHEEYEKYRDSVLKVLSNDNEKLAQRLDREEKFLFENEELEFKKMDFFEKKYKNNYKLYKSIINYLKNDLLNWLIDDYDYVVAGKSGGRTSRAEYLRQKLKILARGLLDDLKDSTKNKKGKNIEGDCIIRDKDIAKYIAEVENNPAEKYSSKFCCLMNGASDGNVKRRLQRQFNTSRMSPKVLIAQSLVGREGLNLHKCCRHVILLHPEWNPGTVEQEIGRVDRIDSLWNRLAEKWQNANPQEETKEKRCPRIEIHYIVFDGTYDQLHFEVLQARMNELNAQLFGSLLETDEQIPEDIAERLKAAAPDFDPCKKSEKK